MDRNTAVVPKQQLGFYNFVARPMFEALDGLVSMAEPLSTLSTLCTRRPFRRSGRRRRCSARRARRRDLF